MYILDTDHISLFQRNESHVTARVLSTPSLELATTIITLEEQVRGRLSRIRQARNDAVLVRAYQNLHATVQFFQTIAVIAFDESAYQLFKSLQAQKIRVGTYDLRIGAIALSQNAILVTRNQRDFAKIPNLTIEDWST